MTKAIKHFILMTGIIFMSSFVEKNAADFIGTYGVSPRDPSEIRLTLNSDHSFYYQDFSNPAKKIIAKGSWKLKRNKVVLQAEDQERNFHNVWTFTDDGQVAKSRKEFLFYRLGKVKN